MPRKKKEQEIIVTQSMMKDFMRYKNEKLCGLQFKAKYIDRVQFESSDTQKLGQYFEYLCTKALTKHGDIPVPETTSKGELTAKYKLAKKQVEAFKRTMDKYGFKVVSIGKTTKYKNAEGTIDIEAVATIDIRTGEDLIKAGERIIIDLKYSGLIEGYQARVSEFGWDYETLHEKEGTVLQAVHYKWLMKQKTLWDYHFFFNVYSSTDEGSSRLFYMNISHHNMEAHAGRIKNAAFAVKTEMESGGFIPYPNVDDCKECPLKDKCEHFIDVPKIQIVNC